MVDTKENNNVTRFPWMETNAAELPRGWTNSLAGVPWVCSSRNICGFVTLQNSKNDANLPHQRASPRPPYRLAMCPGFSPPTENSWRRHCCGHKTHLVVVHATETQVTLSQARCQRIGVSVIVNSVASRYHHAAH